MRRLFAEYFGALHAKGRTAFNHLQRDVELYAPNQVIRLALRTDSINELFIKKALA